MDSDLEELLWECAFLIGDHTTHGGNQFEFNGRREFIFRLVCQKLVNAMPLKGLEECAHTLKDMFEFYAYEPQTSLPAPSVEKVEARITHSLGASPNG